MSFASSVGTSEYYEFPPLFLESSLNPPPPSEKVAAASAKVVAAPEKAAEGASESSSEANTEGGKTPARTPRKRKEYYTYIDLTNEPASGPSEKRLRVIEKLEKARTEAFAAPKSISECPIAEQANYWRRLYRKEAKKFEKSESQWGEERVQLLSKIAKLTAVEFKPLEKQKQEVVAAPKDIGKYSIPQQAYAWRQLYGQQATIFKRAEIQWGLERGKLLSRVAELTVQQKEKEKA